MAAGPSGAAAARQRWELENNVQRDEQVAMALQCCTLWSLSRLS